MTMIADLGRREEFSLLLRVKPRTTCLHQCYTANRLTGKPPGDRHADGARPNDHNVEFRRGISWQVFR
jgi:hypothetical protein